MATGIPIIRKRQKAVLNVKSMSDLSKLLQCQEHVMAAHALTPEYDTYFIPKKNGKRLIEDPSPVLKEMQGILNDHLQAVYFYIRPAGVLGFCISSTTGEEKNIVSNAKKHIGNEYMINIDLKDFFHQIETNRVAQIINDVFIHSETEVKDMITALMVYKGRLPMGAPTSPILSNFALQNLDHEITNICQSFGVTFTRYADDLTFSSMEYMNDTFEAMIKDAIAYEGFEINPEKVKHYLPSSIKIVTGIVVGREDLRLPELFLDQLQKEVIIYGNVVLAEHRYQTGMSQKKLDQFRQEISGKISFAAMVDSENPKLLKIIDTFNANDEIENLSFDWLDIPYA